MDLEERTNSQRQESEQIEFQDDPYQGCMTGEEKVGGVLRTSFTGRITRDVLNDALSRPSLSHLLAESLEIPEGEDLLRNSLLIKQKSLTSSQ